MKIFGEPVLKLCTNEKLHISKEPGVISWACIILSVFVGIWLNCHFVPDKFLYHMICLGVFLVIGFHLMETWYDFVMDREENLITFVKKSWYHDFSLRIPEENVRRFPMSSVSSVVINSKGGIELINNDGTSTLISGEHCSQESLNTLRKHITEFLRLDRIQVIPEYMYYFDHFYDDNVSIRNDEDVSDTETLSSVTQSELDLIFTNKVKIISPSSLS